MRLCTDLKKAKAGDRVLWQLGDSDPIRDVQIHAVNDGEIVLEWGSPLVPGDHFYLVKFNAVGEQVWGGFTIGQRIYPYKPREVIGYVLGYVSGQWLRFRARFFRWLGMFLYHLGGKVRL